MCTHFHDPMKGWSIIVALGIMLTVGQHALAADSWMLLRNVMQNKVHAVEQIIKDGADINSRGLDDGNTSLHWAAFHGYREMANLLIANGADVNLKNKEGNTPLHWAVGEGKLEIVKILIANGADINSKGKANWTPLRWAKAMGNTEIADFLLSVGAME